MSALVLLPGWLAAGIDARTRRIPNWLSAAGMAVALGFAAMQGSLVASLMGAGICLLIGVAIAAIARGGFGGGDVKLMAYGGAAVGAGAVPAFLFWMSLAGGAMALVTIAVLRRREATIPYGPAIAAGCSVAFLLA